MQNKYKVSERNGQPAIFTDRGLVCLMEAGNQSTRERDAAEIVAILNAAPDLLQVARDFLLLAALHDWEGAAIDFAKATLSKAEGVK
jgi:hypothetical protein